jgi:hypothetical protein
MMHLTPSTGNNPPALELQLVPSPFAQMRSKTPTARTAPAAAVPAATCVGYDAFELSVRRVLDRRGATASMDDTWMDLSRWIDKYFIEHDSVMLATDAMQCVDMLPQVDSRQAPTRLQTACLVLDECLSLLSHQFHALESTVQWTRREVYSWLFVHPDGPVSAWDACTVGAPDGIVDMTRRTEYSAKTYRSVLREAASRMSRRAAVEFGESIKESMLQIIDNRATEGTRMIAGMCFRQWRRQCTLSRKRNGVFGGMEPSRAFDDLLPLMERLRQENEALTNTLEDALRERAQLRARVDELQRTVDAFEHPPPPPERLRLALLEAASLETQLEELQESVAAATAIKVYGPVALPAITRQHTSIDITRSWLSLHSKESEVNFESPASVVAAYAYALHARCPSIANHSRLNAVVLPDSVSIRRSQLGRLIEGHFGVSAALVDTAIGSGILEAHVPVVTQLLVAVQRLTRRCADPQRLDSALRHQLEYAAVLETLVLTQGSDGA